VLLRRFTSEEVLEHLRVADARDGRTAAVHAAAARTGVWANRLSDKTAFQLGRAAGRLPSVVYWYSQGVSLNEIGRRLSPFGSAWDARRALGVAAELIAAALNRGEVHERAA
jgi:hypothetical protein